MLRPETGLGNPAPDAVFPVNAEMDREVWFYVHVPKCAGRTVEHHLQENLDDEELWRPQRAPSPGFYLGRQYRLDERFKVCQTRVVTGHFLGRSIAHYFPGASIRQAILIRDPMSYLVSLYNYRMYRYKRRGAKQIPFEHWYKTRSADPISTFILRRYMEFSPSQLWVMTRDKKAKILSGLLDRFDYVGSYNFCSTFLQEFSSRLGIERQHVSKNVLSKDERLIDVDDIPVSVRDKIIESCALDIWLWETYRERGWTCEPTRVPPRIGDYRLQFFLRDLCRAVHSVRARMIRGAIGEIS